MLHIHRFTLLCYKGRVYSVDKMVKNSEAGEDEVRRAERELQDLTDTYVAKIDELLKHKETELLEI